VLVFPESWLRRRAEQGPRRFGQELWHVLRQRPATPVIACWIEGGWGTYTSYWNGPPLVNKSLDWWRKIDAAIAKPQVLDASLLTDHRTTRGYLRQMCLDARSYLGLPPLYEDRQAKEVSLPTA
jgi:hypothetical protein